MLDSRSVPPRRLFLLVGVLLAAGTATVYVLRDRPAPAVDFTDSLTGPDSPNLAIPYGAYALTPEGLLRTDSVSGRENGNDRPTIRTRSSAYLSRDFVFEVDITIPSDVQDISFVGFGSGAPGPTMNEPSGCVFVRIHHLPGNDGVHLAVSPSNPSAALQYLYHERLGAYPSNRRMTVRFERTGDHMTVSLPDQEGGSLRVRLSAYPSSVREDAAYLFFGSTAEGVIFSNVRVRPRT